MNERNPRSGSAFQAIRAIDYTVIFARNMAAMRRFYERELSPNWIEYRVGDNTLALASDRYKNFDRLSPDDLRHLGRRRGVAAALGADDAVDDGHADAG